MPKSSLKLYYQDLKKSFFKKKNIWKFILAILYMQRLTNISYKNNFKKLIATFFLINIISLITKLIV